MQAGVERMKKTTLPVGMHDKLFKRARVTYTIERDISDFLKVFPTGNRTARDCFLCRYRLPDAERSLSSAFFPAP